MKNIITLICITLSLSLTAQNLLDFRGYRVGWKQGAAWAGFAIAGATHGALEAYHADPYCFERAWGAKEKGFWGSEAWQRNYAGNEYPGNHKSELLWNFGRDVWHTGRWIEGGLLVGGSFTLGIGKRKTKFKVLDIVIGSVIAATVSNLTLNALR